MWRKLAAWLMAVATAGAIGVAQAQAPGDDAEQTQLLVDGANLLRTRRPQEAISGHFDRVIAFYEAKYRDETRQVYCARNNLEVIAVLAKHATENPQKGAVAISTLWCDAYYLKAYALIELSRFPEARSVLEKAVSHAPLNSQYTSELAAAYLKERNWDKALETYLAAEKIADAAPDETSKKRQLAVARRGMGYALIELKRLDEAEARYNQSLETDPGSPLARSQLEYIRRLRTTAPGQ